MTKRIKIHSVDSLIAAVCKTLPPKSKEDLKTINKIKLFVEKFTIQENDNRKNEYTDILFYKTLEVSYMRKDFCKDIMEKYQKWAANIKNMLAQNTNDNITTNYEIKPQIINTKDLQDIRKLNEECERYKTRMDNILIEKRSVRNTDRGIIKYFKSL